MGARRGNDGTDTVTDSGNNRVNNTRTPTPVEQPVTEHVASVPRGFEIRGMAGFKPIPSGTHGFLSKPVFQTGSNILTAEHSDNNSIATSYGGQRIGTLSCKGLSVESSGSGALDQSGAVILNVDHVTLNSSSGSFGYYSVKLTSENRREIRAGLDGLCWR